MARANATFSAKKWARKPWDNNPAAEVTGAQLSRIEMHYIYQGDIEGEASAQYLIVDNAETKGNFVALEKVTGSVGGRSGSFVFHHTGTFDNGNIKGTMIVLPGSGTGELSGISGQASVAIDKHQEIYPITFDYEL